MTSAREFTVRLADLLSRERAALSEFLVALAEFDRRRLWVSLGHSSLSYFLHRELGLSKGAAFYRKTAAELIQKHPDVVEPLRDGRLCLTSVVELSKVLTPENLDVVLPRFFHLSKREAKEVSAALRPDTAAQHREVVTTVRAAVAAPDLVLPLRSEPPRDPAQALVHPDEPARANIGSDPGARVTTGDSALDGPIGPATPAANPPAAAPPPAPRPRTPPSSIEPLTADLNRLHVTVSRRFLEKLEAARAALSHTRPGANAQEILEAGLDLVLERHAKRNGQVKKPRAGPSPSKAEHVPAHVRRAAWNRDGGRCQWRLEGGGICGSTHQVELDHVVARGKGGPSTIENTRLLCGFHNDLAARETYGDDWMDQFTRGPRAPLVREAPASLRS